jgi:hypothetical protein
MIIPNIWKNNPNAPNHQPVSQYWRIKESKIKVTKDVTLTETWIQTLGAFI